jgi:hypothetical protein
MQPALCQVKVTFITKRAKNVGMLNSFLLLQPEPVLAVIVKENVRFIFL